MKKPVSDLVAKIEGYGDRGFEILSIVQNPDETITVMVKVVKEEVDG